jgi:acid phosphatase type 7
VCSHVNSDNPPFWYAFEYGSVHIAIVSSEHSLEHGSKQWLWLTRQLASVDRCKTPWLLLAIHRPLYVVKPHHANRRVAKHLRDELEDVLVKYGVDAVLSGHIHNFSRTCPVIGGKCVPHDKGGILHVITGSGGHTLSKIGKHQDKWLAYARREFGFSRIQVCLCCCASLCYMLSLICVLKAGGAS